MLLEQKDLDPPELRLCKVTNPQGLTWIYQYDAAR